MYTVEKLDDGRIKYSFKVEMEYDISTFPKYDLISLFSQVMGFGNKIEYDWPFEITRNEEISAEELLDYIEKFTAIIVSDTEFREKSIPVVEAGLLLKIKELW